GAARRVTGWSCSRPRGSAPTLITAIRRPISCCSGANPLGSPTTSQQWPTRCGRRARQFRQGELVSYAVKEIFLTLQGEGAHAGRAAVFCRFSGCNLWSGREPDRAGATCKFCDTDFVGTDGTLGGRYSTADELADVIAGQWTGDDTNRYVVLTGGEPLLQVDTPF